MGPVAARTLLRRVGDISHGSTQVRRGFVTGSPSAGTMLLMCTWLASVVGWLWGALTAVASWMVGTLPGLLQTTVSLATLLALVVAWRQLVLSQNLAGGRQFEFSSWRVEDAESLEDDGIVYQLCTVKVKLTGPAVLHSVFVHLEVDGERRRPGSYSARLNPSDRNPRLRKTLTSADPQIDWEFWLPVDVIPNAKCLLSWLETFGEGIRTAALRQDLTTPDVEQWRWYLGHRYRSAFRRWAAERRPWFLTQKLAKPRPLGRYVKINTEQMRDGEGPFGQP